MTRIVRFILTMANVRPAAASSAFAQNFGQPSMACYGQAVDGHDETIFSIRGRIFSLPQGRIGH